MTPPGLEELKRFALALGSGRQGTATAMATTYGPGGKVKASEDIVSLINQIEGMRAAVQKRRDIYADKRDKADPLADDDCNRHERMNHTVEAFDILLEEMGLSTEDRRDGG